LALQSSNDSRLRVNPSTIPLCTALDVCGQHPLSAKRIET
jgi:hypothetical protein